MRKFYVGVGCTSQQPDGFLPLRAFKPSSSESADRGRSIIKVRLFAYLENKYTFILIIMI
jgi:hypothetical protein